MFKIRTSIYNDYLIVQLECVGCGKKIQINHGAIES